MKTMTQHLNNLGRMLRNASINLLFDWYAATRCNAAITRFLQ
jgi:hypothetical protein